MLRPLTEAPRGRISQLTAGRAASSVTSPRCQVWSSRPPTPSGLSLLWSGPATKPSREMDMWQVVSVMSAQTGAAGPYSSPGTLGQLLRDGSPGTGVLVATRCALVGQ